MNVLIHNIRCILQIYSGAKLKLHLYKETKAEKRKGGREVFGKRL